MNIPTTIGVTQEDIDRGQRCDSHFCPIAMAVIRHITPDVIVDVTYRVDLSWLGDNYEEYDVSIPLPHPVQYFIGRFDAGHRVLPFDFQLDLPVEVLA